MHIYKWWIVFIVETLLIVLSLTFLAKQSSGAQLADYVDRTNHLQQATTYPDNGGITSPKPINSGQKHASREPNMR